MTQDEFWQWKYQKIIDYIETYHRDLSKHRIKEHLIEFFQIQPQTIECRKDESRQS